MIIEKERHSSSPLRALSKAGNHFFVCQETGSIYYRNAKQIQYKQSYFQEEYQKQYNKTYLEDEQNLRQIARRRLKQIQKYKKNGSILEIGCAMGFFLDEAAQMGYEVSGIEICPYAATYATEQLGLEVFVGDFFEFSRTIAPYDIVASYFTLEHFSRQKSIMQMIESLLKTDGLFSFALPSAYGPLFHFHRKEWMKTHPTDHFVDYSPSSIRKVLAKYNLKVLKVQACTFHKARFPFMLKYFFSAALRLFVSLFAYGDTMEGLAKKIR